MTSRPVRRLSAVGSRRSPLRFTNKPVTRSGEVQRSSAILKQRPARAWLNAHADPGDTVLYVGIDWSEARRTSAIVNGWAPWSVRFPMCEPPYLSKEDMLGAARAEGLTPPRLYELGFSHNNFFWTTESAAARRLTSVLCHTGLPGS